jgi:hypothetical protein
MTPNYHRLIGKNQNRVHEEVVSPASTLSEPDFDVGTSGRGCVKIGVETYDIRKT